jgi:hypothetical protein
MLPNLAALRVDGCDTGAPKRARPDEDAPPPTAGVGADVAGAIALAAVSGAEDCKALNKLIATLSLVAGKEVGDSVLTDPSLWYAACTEFDFPPLDPRAVPTLGQAPEAMGYAYWRERFRSRCEQFHLALRIARERFEDFANDVRFGEARHLVGQIVERLAANANDLRWVRKNERWVRVAMHSISPQMLIASPLNRLRTNKELLLQALGPGESDDDALQTLPKDVRDALLLDDDLFVAAARVRPNYANPFDSQFAARPDVPLGGYDRALSLRLLEANHTLLGFMGEQFTTDVDFMLEAVRLNVRVLENVSKSSELFTNREFVLLAVTHNPMYIQDASDELKNDQKTFEAAFDRNPGVFAFAGARTRSDRSVALRAVAADGNLLQHASEALRADREVVTTAMRTQMRSVQHATNAFLRENFDLVEAAYALEPSPRWTGLTYARLRDVAPPDAWDNRDFALSAVKRLPVVYSLLSDALKSDIVIARIAYESPSVRRSIPGSLRVLIEGNRLPPAWR